MLDQEEKKRSEFTTNILKLVSGTFIAQLITVGLSPILSRLFSPEDFGLFTFFSSIFGLTALISGGRYENAVLLPKKNETAANVLLLSLFINLLFLVFSYVILIPLSFFINLKGLELWYFLIPVFTFFVGLAQCLSVWYNRRKQYNHLVYYRISNAFLNGGGSVFFGFLKFPFNGLLSAFLASNILSITVLLYFLKKDLKIIRQAYSKTEMKEVAKRYIRFPMYNALQAVLDALQINGMVYLITFFFGSFYVGLFSQAVRILFMPMNLIGASIAQVFYQQATEYHHQQKSLKPLMKKAIQKSLLVSIPVCVVILAAGPQLFAFVFGKVWYDAGVYARIMVCWFMLDFLRAPLSQLPIIFDKQRIMMLFSLCSNLMIAFFIVFGSYMQLGIVNVLIMITCSQVAYTLLVIWWIWLMVDKEESKNSVR